MKLLTRRHEGDDRLCLAAGRRAHRNPGRRFHLGGWRRGEKAGAFTRIRCWSTPRCCCSPAMRRRSTCCATARSPSSTIPTSGHCSRRTRPARRSLATEECLRYDSPVKSIQRIASEDVEMRGKVLRKNDRVRWFISSANRDPAMFEKPDHFDIQPVARTSMSPFGSGIHHCMGATLARVRGPGGVQGPGGALPRLPAR